MDDDVEEGISVIGSGRVTVEPDIATLRVGVSLADQDLSRVRSEVAAKLTAARDQLLAQGVAPVDVRTAHLDVHTSNDPNRGRRTHHVSSTLEAVLRDVSMAEVIVDRLFTAIGSGLELHGLEFGVVDPRPGRDRAMELAVADARHSAERLARSSGVTLGRVLAVREVEHHRGSFTMAVRMKATADVSMPIESGQLEQQATVAMRFAIVDPDA